jgi:hypothetical protein
LKFELLATGVALTSAAARSIAAATHGRQATPADYASTSGLILRLPGDVWVNVPTSEWNPNFVDDLQAPVLDADGTGALLVRSGGTATPAQVWIPPRYHGENGADGRPINHFVFSHGDRVRLSPLRGCSLSCRFCPIPFADRYSTKPIPSMLDAIAIALEDPWQPAHHVLISGGTPRPADFDYLRDTYEQVLRRFPGVPVDIMMVPVDGLLDVPRLADLGLHELSINIELVDDQIAQRYMRQKRSHGLDHYLRCIEDASSTLGEGRVRSMLMVGLEPVEATLEGVRRIVDAGGVPVLSPFRPDPATPLAHLAPPSAAELRETFLAATAVVSAAGRYLGPTCPPCTHNTATLLGPDPEYLHPLPQLA